MEQHSGHAEHEGEERHTGDSGKRPTMDVLQCIFTRRAVRKFLDKDVEWDKIVTILMAGNYAPSSGNLQNWKFFAVKDDAKRKKLAEACLQQYWMQDAPVHIVVCGEPHAAKRFYGIRGERVYTLQNCAAAIENMLLTAHALGLGSCWVGAFEEDMVRRIVNIPSNMTVYAVLPIGYPAEIPEPLPKARIEHVAQLEGYGGVMKMPYWAMGWYREAWPHVGKAVQKTRKRLHEHIKEKIAEIKEKLRRKNR